jgi:hypothetical protein
VPIADFRQKWSKPPRPDRQFGGISHQQLGSSANCEPAFPADLAMRVASGVKPTI